MASWDIRTARPNVIAKVLEEIGMHGDLIAAMPTETQDLLGAADVEACQVDSWYSRWIGQGGVHRTGGQAAIFVVDEHSRATVQG